MKTNKTSSNSITKITKIDKNTRVIERNTSSETTSSGSMTTVRILGLVLNLLIFVALIRSLLGFEPIYFSSFLEMLANAPTINITLSMTDLTIGGSWGIFDFLRYFINLFTGLLSLLSFIANGLINLIMYMLYFTRFLFTI